MTKFIPLILGFCITFAGWLFFREIYRIGKENREYHEQKAAHVQKTLDLCGETCGIYKVNLCYFADNQNIFIGCANDPERLITKSFPNK